MKRWIIALLCFCLMGIGVVPSHAGEHADKLTSCLLDSTTQKDKLVFARWVGFAISRHKAVADQMTISDEYMIQASNDVGKLVIYLMGDVCRDLTEKALKQEGPAAIQQSFHVLGQAASYELFSDPEVQQSMTHVGRYLKENFPKELK